MAYADRIDGFLDRGERFESQKVDLEHADSFDRLHRKLGDEHVGVFGSADRNVIGERISGDDQSGRMDARIADRSFQLSAQYR